MPLKGPLRFCELFAANLSPPQRILRQYFLSVYYFFGVDGVPCVRPRIGLQGLVLLIQDLFNFVKPNCGDGVFLFMDKMADSHHVTVVLADVPTGCLSRLLKTADIPGCPLAITENIDVWV